MDYNRTFEHWFAFAQAIQPDTPIYGVINSLHGFLDKPLIEGETVVYNRLPANINLLLVGSHGNIQIGKTGSRDTKKHKKRLEVMQKFWKKNLFDEEEISCITQEGEELLANLVTVEFLGKTYKEEYGKDLNKQTDRDLRTAKNKPWFALTDPRKAKLFQDKDFDPNNYTALLKFLKIYKGNEEYNEQLFTVRTMDDISNFGISFLCTENGRSRGRFYVFLKLENFIRENYGDEISKLVGDGKIFFIEMSKIFEYVQNISTASEINLMYHSCRKVSTSRVDAYRLTKQLSNRKEKNSIYCFIKKFIPEYLQGGILDYFESLKPGIITIFDFYDMLKSRNKFDRFLIAISKFYANKEQLLSFFEELITEANERKITEEEALREQVRLNETTGAFSMHILSNKDYENIAQGGGKKRKSRRTRRKGRKSKIKRKCRRHKSRRTRRR